MIHTVSITDLKQNTATVINKVKTLGKSVVIMQRSQAAAVLVDPKYYSALEEAFEDLEDLRDIELHKNEPTVPLDEYLMRRFNMTVAGIKKLKNEGSFKQKRPKRS